MGGRVRQEYPKIRFAKFLDPRPPREPPPPDSQDVARTTSDGSSSAVLVQKQLVLEGVWVRDGNGASSPVCVYEQDRDHAALPEGTPRFVFRVAGPGDPAVAPADSVTVCWRLRARKRAKLRGVLELFIVGSPGPVWRRELNDAELRTEPPDVQPADRLGGTIFGGFAWDGHLDAVDPAHQAAFADGHLLAAKSPYKLKLSVYTAKKRKITAARQAWTYFDVPAWHKYKLAAYVPSTNLGCFGLEFDPEEPMIKVFSKVFTLAEQFEERWYQRSPAARRAEFAAACERAWGDLFELNCGGAINRTWRVALRVEDAGGATSRLDGMTIANRERAVASAIAAQRVHLAVVLKPKNGGSGLTTTTKNPYANIFLFEHSAFESHHPSITGGQVLGSHLTVLYDRLLQSYPQGGPGVAAESADPPTFAVPFQNGNAVLSLGERQALQQIAAEVAASSRTCAIPVYVTATGVRDGPEEVARAAAVYNELQAHLPNGHPLVQDTADDPQKRVLVRLGYRDNLNELSQVPVAYNAAVHEFGHSFGLVDEYMDYGATPGFGNVAPAQARMRALCVTHGVSSWPRPERNHFALMSVGSQVYKRYYLPLLEALTTIVGLKLRTLAANWSIVDRAGNNPLPPVTESPDFDPLVRCLEAVEQRARRNDPRPRKLRRALRDEIAAQGLDARLEYVRAVERDNLGAGLQGQLAPDLPCLVGLGVWRGNTLLHAATCVQVREVDPVLEVEQHLSVSPVGAPRTFVLHPRRAGHRHPVRLRASQRFIGHGTLTCDQNGVEFYRQASGGAPVYERQTHPAGLQLTRRELIRGVTLYVRGLTAPTRVELALASNVSHTRVAAEAVILDLPTGASLRVHPCSRVTGGKRSALTSGQMQARGVFVPLTPDKHHPAPRCRVVVHRPAGVVGNLYLRVSPECSLHTAAVGGARVSKKVKRKQGGVKAKWQEVKLKPGSFNADGLRTLWLQGDVISSGCTLNLLDAGNNTLATCKVTVVDLRSIVVRIPATPALTPRNLPADNRPQDQEFNPGAPEALRDLDFDANPPLVLLAGSASPLRPPQVIVRLQPSVAKYASLLLERAADDHPNLRAAYAEPTPLEVSQIGPINPDGTEDVTCSLPTDAVGSFHIRVSVGGTCLAVLNYVGVEAVAVKQPGQSKPKTGIVAGFAAQAQTLQEGKLLAHTGQVPFPDPQHSTLGQLRNHACTRHVGRIRLTGGGPDGKRGLDRVFAGWVQNKTAGRIEADYTDFHTGNVHTARGQMVSNQQAAEPLWDRDRGFTATTAAAPVPLAQPAPLLDTGRTPNGGMTATLGSRKLERDNTPLFGQELVAVAVDSPGTEFPCRHRSHADALLTEARYDLTFIAYLCAWTDMSGRDAGDGAGDRLYGVVGRFQWQVEGTWSVTWPNDVQGYDQNDRAANPDWWRTATVAETRTFRAFRDHYDVYPRAQPAEGHLEVRPPTPLQVFAWDFR